MLTVVQFVLLKALRSTVLNTESSKLTHTAHFKMVSDLTLVSDWFY